MMSSWFGVIFEVRGSSIYRGWEMRSGRVFCNCEKREPKLEEAVCKFSCSQLSKRYLLA